MYIMKGKNTKVKKHMFRIVWTLALAVTFFVTSAICSKAISEVEDNGRDSTAMDLPVNTSMTGTTIWEDEDHFKITLSDPGTISYTFSHESLSGVLFLVQIHNANGDEISSDLIKGDSAEEFTGDSYEVPAGVYYLYVEGSNRTTTTEYSIIVNYTAKNEGKTDNTDNSNQSDKERIDAALSKLEEEINLDSDSVNMFRLYNEKTGEHFYTSSKKEAKSLINSGWKYEGVAWVAPKESSIPVYRLYNYNSGEHHYTTSMKEAKNLYTTASGNNSEEDIKGQGWDFEGIGWYSDDNKGTPLYRLYNPNATGDKEPGSHHYTKSKKERDSLVDIGWRDEGIGWYGY